MEHSIQEALHTPVMVDEVLHWLITESEGWYVDGTVGTGGHTAALLSRLSPGGKVLGIDLDHTALAVAHERLSAETARLTLRQGSYAQAHLFLHELGEVNCQGILLDLGLSSYCLEGSGRGFSFQADEPLDMRFDPNHGRPLYQILPHLSRNALTDILVRFGEDRQARSVATAIYRAATQDRLETTAQLVDTIRLAVRGPLLTKTLARTFQALRIFVNDELNTLQTALERLTGILRTGARAVMITYHSLEDRMVKQFFARESRDCLCPPQIPQCVCSHSAAFKILTPKPVTPASEERMQNPRSRSAKLRAVERL